MTVELVLKIAIILILAFSFWMVKYKKQNNARFFVLVYCILTLVSGVISWKVIDMLPIPTENVTITAMRQKNEKSKGDEIYLTKISANGKEIELKTATDDKWFWQGDLYIWRNELDLRRPEELSDSFVLKIPVGTKRYIEFFTNIYKGIVEIEYQGNVTVVDCYSETNNRVCAKIDDTQEEVLTLYAIALFFLFGIVDIIILYTVLAIYKNRGRIYCLLSTHTEESVLIVLLVILSFFSFNYSTLQSFWGDEIHQIAYSSPLNTISQVISYSTRLSDINPPLYAIILYGLRRYLPYGQQWLLSVNIILVILGILLIYLSLSKINKKIALITTFIIILNSSIYSYGIFELRPYSLLFMLASFLFFGLVKRSKSKGYSAHICLMFILNCILLCYSHIFGVLMVFCLAVVDFSEIIYQRLSIQYIKIYVFTGFAFLPYVASVLFNYFSKNTYYGIQNPGTKIADLRKFYLIEKFLNGSNYVFLCLLLIGVSLIFSKKEWRSSQNTRDVIGRYAVFLSFLVLGISFALSRMFNTSYMKERYYICLIPYVAFISANAFEYIYNHLYSIKKLSPFLLCIFIILANALHTNYFVHNEQLRSNQPFREAAEYLTSKTDFYSSNVAIMICGRDPMRFGWQYYLSKDLAWQQREILSWSNSQDKESLKKYKKLYVFYPYSISDGFKAFLKDLGFEQSDSNSSLRLLTYEKNYK